MSSDGRQSASGRFRFGDFEFDSRSGHLWRWGSANGVGTHLPPQPAKLLRLLIERSGELVTRDEIRAELWPDTHVELDQSVNFCVHRIRTALADSADHPAYIETLPRRGYRLLQPAVPVAVEAGLPRNRRNFLVAGLAVVVGVALAGLFALHFVGEDTARSQPPTIAIMALRPPEGRELAGEPERVAERLLLQLGALGSERLGVVGPATTARYAGDPDLRRLLEETGVDWVINGRFIDSFTSPTGTGLLIEVIRASDGVHVWVESVDDASQTEAIARRIVAATTAQLSLGTTDRQSG